MKNKLILILLGLVMITSCSQPTNSSSPEEELVAKKGAPKVDNIVSFPMEDIVYYCEQYKTQFIFSAGGKFTFTYKSELADLSYTGDIVEHLSDETGYFCILHLDEVLSFNPNIYPKYPTPIQVKTIDDKPVYKVEDCVVGLYFIYIDSEYIDLLVSAINIGDKVVPYVDTAKDFWSLAENITVYRDFQPAGVYTNKIHTKQRMSQAQIKLPLNNTLPLERKVYDNLKNLESSKERHDFIITRLVGILLVAVSVHFTNAFNAHAMKLVWALVL